jgi:hypothetical protein
VSDLPTVLEPENQPNWVARLHPSRTILPRSVVVVDLERQAEPRGVVRDLSLTRLGNQLAIEHMFE